MISAVLAALGPAGVVAALGNKPPFDIQKAEEDWLKLPQVDCPLVHLFSDNAYFRLICMAAGSYIIGHKHRTKHFNVVLQGRATVMMDGEVHEIVAPAIFESQPGVRKVLYIHEDTIWGTLHVTPETDLAKLENLLIEKSDAFVQHQLEADAKKLRELLEAAPPDDAKS